LRPLFDALEDDDVAVGEAVLLHRLLLVSQGRAVVLMKRENFFSLIYYLLIHIILLHIIYLLCHLINDKGKFLVIDLLFINTNYILIYYVISLMTRENF
jgi:hypothetical protein